MNNILLYEEYRLIEQSEAYVNRAWKGAHLLLFFLAFVFGSFCTFCFHMLMYLFDEKCVLFPKLLSLTSMRHNVIYEFMPPKHDLNDLPVDFVSTQWVEKSTCALPTYVPLISGIFGLVWTTMFLMCSTGTRTLMGLQRPWRVLPPVFLFSLAMSILCIYSSVITHSGLQELCVKLGEITGTSTCSYAVNVVTLVYERRIRGVYQATRLTIVSAWLHTGCWLCSALLALLRIILAVDFQLVRLKVTLHADVDSLMDRDETQLRSVSPDDHRSKDQSSNTNENFNSLIIIKAQSDSMASDDKQDSLVPSLTKEEQKLNEKSTHDNFSSDKRFIFNMLHNLVDKMVVPNERDIPLFHSLNSLIELDNNNQNFLEYINLEKDLDTQQYNRHSIADVQAMAKEIVYELVENLKEKILEVRLTPNMLTFDESLITDPDITKHRKNISYMLFDDKHSKFKKICKSNLKTTGTQTSPKKKKSVLIFEKSSNIQDDEGSETKPNDIINEVEENEQTIFPKSTTSKTCVDKETQVRRKEKQD